MLHLNIHNIKTTHKGCPKNCTSEENSYYTSPKSWLNFGDSSEFWLVASLSWVFFNVLTTNFNHDWGYTLIHLPLSYPFRSLQGKYNHDWMMLLLYVFKSSEVIYQSWFNNTKLISFYTQVLMIKKHQYTHTKKNKDDNLHNSEALKMEG